MVFGFILNCRAQPNRHATEMSNWSNLISNHSKIFRFIVTESTHLKICVTFLWFILHVIVFVVMSTVQTVGKYHYHYHCLTPIPNNNDDNKMMMMMVMMMMMIKIMLMMMIWKWISLKKSSWWQVYRQPSISPVIQDRTIGQETSMYICVLIFFYHISILKWHRPLKTFPVNIK